MANSKSQRPIQEAGSGNFDVGEETINLGRKNLTENPDAPFSPTNFHTIQDAVDSLGFRIHHSITELGLNQSMLIFPGEVSA